VTVEPGRGHASTAESLAVAARELLDGIAVARSFARGWPDLVATRPIAPRRLPVLEWLDGAPGCATPATEGLVEAIAAGAGALAWHQTYTAADVGAGFLDRYGWTELVGLRGPIPSETMACGMLMLGPDTHYPAHAHEAEELYLPLAGCALWKRGRDPYAERRPGTPIHHPSRIQHAMRTGPEPLLALYVWRGGLAVPSRLLQI
jgi:hypothetical protein